MLLFRRDDRVSGQADKEVMQALSRSPSKHAKVSRGHSLAKNEKFSLAL
jgi:hypothetical protein